MLPASADYPSAFAGGAKHSGRYGMDWGQLRPAGRRHLWRLQAERHRAGIGLLQAGGFSEVKQIYTDGTGLLVKPAYGQVLRIRERRWLEFGCYNAGSDP